MRDVEVQVMTKYDAFSWLLTGLPSSNNRTRRAAMWWTPTGAPTPAAATTLIAPILT